MAKRKQDGEKELKKATTPKRSPSTRGARARKSAQDEAGRSAKQTVNPARVSKARNPVASASGGTTAVQEGTPSAEPVGEPARSMAEEHLDARIAIRAYELYQRRGGHHGQDLDDWFEAERQVRAEHECGPA